MSSGPQVCRWGFDCRRTDCWFIHPQGRAIDGAAPPPPSHPSSVISSSSSGGLIPLPAPLPSSSSRQNHSSTINNYSSPSERKTVAVCRYGRACHRSECWFSHPEGRDIDDRPSMNGSSNHHDGIDQKELDEEEMILNQIEAEKGFNDDECACCGGDPYNCTTPDCVSQGICDCLMDAVGEGSTQNTPSARSMFGGSDIADDSWRDEWFPTSRTCSCCEGYVYRCKHHNSSCTGKCYCHDVAAVNQFIGNDETKQNGIVREESKSSVPSS